MNDAVLLILGLIIGFVFGTIASFGMLHEYKMMLKKIEKNMVYAITKLEGWEDGKEEKDERIKETNRH